MKIFAIFSLFLSHVFCEEYYNLQTDQGWLKGKLMNSRDNQKFAAFQKIPYAKPPVKMLRFENPQPADSWKDILDATEKPPMCLHVNKLGHIGTEDCLYLNVYTPKKLFDEITTKGPPCEETSSSKNSSTLDVYTLILKVNPNALLPVIVFIHSEGYYFGGIINMAGPQYLLDKDVVFVSINYRLGIPGFLSTEDNVLPGNYGLKDQVEALKWVQKYIPNFGGNPKNVTLFGSGSGSSCVGLHLLSSMSKELFHKAIMQSGTPFHLWAVSPSNWAGRRARALSTFFGCPREEEEMVKCFKNIDEEKLALAYVKLFEWKDCPLNIFMPVVENCVDEKKSFLCKHPLIDFQIKSNVPIIIGVTTAEGGYLAAKMYDDDNDQLLYTELNENFNNYISSMLLYKYSKKSTEIVSTGQNIKERYFGNNDLNNPLMAVKMISGITIYGVLQMLMALSSPVYFYVYDHQNVESFNSLYGSYSNPLGVTHADDLTSLLPRYDFLPLKDRDLEVSKFMVNLWSRFATKITIDKLMLTDDDTENGMEWPKFDKNKMKYLLIDSGDPKIHDELMHEYMSEYNFWNDQQLFSEIIGNKNDA